MKITLEELLAAIQVVLDRNHPQTTKQFRDLQDELLRLRREPAPGVEPTQLEEIHQLLEDVEDSIENGNFDQSLEQVGRAIRLCQRQHFEPEQGGKPVAP